MADILVIGSGLGGLTAATLLASDGHRVTVLERDPASCPETPAEAWDGWSRRGVHQFRLPHFMLPRWWTEIRASIPGLASVLDRAGALRFNSITSLPAAVRGPVRADDRRFDTVTARRPVLEAALVSVALDAGVTIRRGVAVTGFTTDGRPGIPRVTGIPRANGIPRVTGVLTDRGTAIHADLVVDSGGRRSALTSWLTAAGARPPVVEREDSGFVYYGRHFRGPMPSLSGPVLQNHDSLSVLTLPADNDTWSVVLTTSSRDQALRALRDPAVWNAVVARYPLTAPWVDASPLTGVDVFAGLADRRTVLVVDGDPVATGVVAVADAWACTNPSLGRGAAMAVLHARLLRDLLRSVDPADPDQLARRFHELTTEVVEPLFESTRWYDRHRLAEIDSDIAGVPYRTPDHGWIATKALFAAALTDPDRLRDHSSVAAFLTTGAEVFARPGVAEHTMAAGGGAPQYPLAGPGRSELLEIVRH